ncbi:MAG: hypothetical protein IJU41_07085, partial [Clostridia bacterium]|nr:hypothetical protein [Clostridia bacterium]
MKKIILLLLFALLLTPVAFAESGDFNGDGAETLSDVLAIFKESLAIVPSTYADVSGDGRVSVSDGLVLLSRILDCPQAAEANDVSDRLAFTTVSAASSYNNGQLVLNSTGTGGDGFATSNFYFPGGSSFSIEATMRLTDGDCGGITFGVASPQKPSVAWYCVNVNRATPKTRLFSVGVGTVGTASAAQRSLTAAETEKDTFTVRIEVTERGRISYWLDGGFVASYDEPDFAGGYLGFNTFQSRAIFSDIRIRTGENTIAKDSPFQIVSGNWNYSGGDLTATNAARGDSFAMTDICVPAGTPFTVSANMRVTGGSRTGGIVFGVGDKTAPASGWYCVNVGAAAGTSRLFSVKTGTIGTGSGTSRALTAEQKTQTAFALTLTVDKDGQIDYALDGEPVFSHSEPTFAGGYIGFNTYKSNVTFSDIEITVGGARVPLGNMALTAGERVIALDPAQPAHDVDLGDFDGTVTLRVDLPDGAAARVGRTAFKNGEYTLTPGYGRTVVKVDLRDRYARKSTVTLRLWRDIPDEQKYADAYRPRCHVTPPENFMNDPNGLFYNELTGEYHVFYQWNPIGMVAGNQVWGHAVSTDLLNWTDCGIAIDRPADGDCIYSGCAVVDKDNTSGLFGADVAPENRVVALYTVTGPFRQELAYSTDGGYTFTKYENNPVIPSSAYFSAFRDPKVQWIAEKGLWLMVVAGGPAELYTSPDLIHWTSQGTMSYLDGTTIESECPMLLALPLDGDENNIKYVYVGAGKFYVVGDLVWEGENVRFVAEQKRNNTLFYADAHYATQNFYNDKSGRTLLVSWMRDNASGFLLEGKYWHGIQSAPYAVTLVTENGQAVLHTAPVEELEAIKGETLCEVSDSILTDEALDTDGVHAIFGLFDLSAKLDSGATLTLALRKGGDYATTFTFRYLSAERVEVTMNTKNSGRVSRITKT